MQFHWRIQRGGGAWGGQKSLKINPTLGVGPPFKKILDPILNLHEFISVQQVRSWSSIRSCFFFGIRFEALFTRNRFKWRPFTMASVFNGADANIIITGMIEKIK